MFVLVFDTETTGLPKTKVINENTVNSWPYIVQLSYIIYDTESNKIIKISDNIAKIPENVELSKESIAIHGIDRNKMNEKGKPIVEILQEFLTTIDSIDLIVCHNIDFDINMIIVEIYRCALDANNSHVKEINLPIIVRLQYMNKYCTMKNSMELCNIKKITKTTGKEYVKFPTLSESYHKLFNEKPNNMHNSLNDVYACFRCFCKLKYNKDICKEDVEFNKLLRDAL
uniref:Exonuclease domain-containing protein n=1 Tax=viral metagenome TaxID=1070528 RepID=A0A6C0EH17_9ZZZZ